MNKKLTSVAVLVSIIVSQFIPILTLAESVDPDFFTTNISASKDTYISEGNVSTNYGNDNDFRIRSKTGDNNQRALVQFSVSSIPSGAVIQSAKMKLYMHEEASGSVTRVYEVFRNLSSWVEGDGGINNSPVNEVRWNNKPSTFGTLSASVQVTPGNNKFIEWDVTEDVQSFVNETNDNNGWMIKDSGEGASGGGYQAKFRSRTFSGTSERPVLEVKYYVYSGSISGKIFNDTDEDGVQDEGELGVSGSTVSITGPISTSTIASSTGDYLFSTLPSGTYTVCQTLPDVNWSQSLPSSGTTCQGGLAGITVIVSANSHSNKNFGIYENKSSIKIINTTNPASTGDGFNFVLQKNGVEVGEIDMIGSDEYTFNNLVTGTYSIVSNLPNGWYLEEEASCLLGEDYIDPNSISLGVGQDVVCTQNATKSASLSVSNYVTPVEGTYTFTLENQDNNSEPIPSATVANLETHTFTSLKHGTYDLAEIIEGGPLGVTASCIVGNTTIDPLISSLTILPGASIQCTYNHGDYAVVQGVVFDDKNADGVQDEADQSLSDWVVRLFKITEEEVVEDDVSNTVIMVADLGSKITTNAGYVFGQLNPGTYRVCQEIKTGWNQTYPSINDGCNDSNGYTFTLDFGNIFTKNFGNFLKAKISGMVFGDINNNGIKDENESGISGVTVYLGESSTLTDINGSYSFVDLIPNDYILTIDIPDNSSYSLPSEGKYEIKVESQGEYENNDFGIFTDTDIPSIPEHLSTADGKPVRSLGLILDWTDSVDPSGSQVSYMYQSSLSGDITTGNALTTPIYSTNLSVSEIDASGTPDGTYFWQVKACDTANNCTDWTNPWSIIVDSVAPVSTFLTPNSDSDILDEYVVVSGFTEDAHGVSSTTLAYAPYSIAEGEEETVGSCGAYLPIVSIVSENASTTFNWIYNWTPEDDGIYCLTAHGEDVAGNVEESPVLINIKFTKKISATTLVLNEGPALSGGNGPISGSLGGGTYGGEGSANSGQNQTLSLGGSNEDLYTTGYLTPGSQINTNNTDTTTNSNQTHITGGGNIQNNIIKNNTPEEEFDTAISKNDLSDRSKQVAAVGLLGEWSNWYWLWLFLILIIISGVYYNMKERKF